MKRSNTLYIGISGWRYPGWRGTFYPEKLRQHEELRFASEHFSTLELNGSFYSLQTPTLYRRWYDETSDDFIFSIKGSRYITHFMRLNNVKTPLANFFASGVFCLREKLGPFLWQFPPRFTFQRESFEKFLELLPKDTDEAEALARRHDSRVSGRAVLKTRHSQLLRHAVEIRHESFIDKHFAKLLEKHRIALVIADTAGQWPLAQSRTSDFRYLRLHGDSQLYTSGYSKCAISTWANRLTELSVGKTASGIPELTAKPSFSKPNAIFVYFDNDAKVKAPRDALALAAACNVPRQPDHIFST